MILTRNRPMQIELRVSSVAVAYLESLVRQDIKRWRPYESVLRHVLMSGTLQDTIPID
jgi:hypothetical protein